MNSTFSSTPGRPPSDLSEEAISQDKLRSLKIEINSLLTAEQNPLTAQQINNKYL